MFNFRIQKDLWDKRVTNKLKDKMRNFIFGRQTTPTSLPVFRDDLVDQTDEKAQK